MTQPYCGIILRSVWVQLFLYIVFSKFSPQLLFSFLYLFPVITPKISIKTQTKQSSIQPLNEQFILFYRHSISSMNDKDYLHPITRILLLEFSFFVLLNYFITLHSNLGFFTYREFLTILERVQNTLKPSKIF